MQLSENKMLLVTETDKKYVRYILDQVCKGLTTLTEAFVAIDARHLAVQWFDCSKKEITLLKYTETSETFIRGETLILDYRTDEQALKLAKIYDRCVKLLTRVLTYNETTDLNKDQFHGAGEMQANIIKEFEDLPIPDYCWTVTGLFWFYQKAELARAYHSLPSDETDSKKLEAIIERVNTVYLRVNEDILKKLNLQ
jgi:hypothetical protein